jgi:hypothetical protein
VQAVQIMDKEMWLDALKCMFELLVSQDINCGSRDCMMQNTMYKVPIFISHQQHCTELSIHHEGSKGREIMFHLSFNLGTTTTTGVTPFL